MVQKDLLRTLPSRDTQEKTIHNVKELTHFHPRFVVFLTGLAHITLPSSSTSAYILGGSASSLIVAADTSGTGHYTNYPSGDFTTALQVPVKGGIEAIPAYRVLDGEGPCRNAQQIGAKTSLMQRVLETVGRHHNRDEPTGEMENGGRREL